MKDKEKLINETKAFYNKVDEIKEEIIKDKQQQIINPIAFIRNRVYLLFVFIFYKTIQIVL